MVYYLHKTLEKSPAVSTLYDTFVVAPVCASNTQSVRSSCITSVITCVHASSVPPVCTSCITSVFAPVHAMSVPSILPYDDECQEFLDEFPSTNYGDKTLSEITVEFSHNVTQTLQQVKFPEETTDTTKRVNPW